MIRTTIVAVLLSVAAASSADAAPDELRAKQFFSAGSLAYERGRYTDAVRAFEAAYAAYPNPAIAFSLAQAHRRQYFVDADRTRVDRAIELYRVYLDGKGSKKRAGEATDQIQSLESIRLRLAAASEPPPPPAPVRTEVMIYSAAPEAVAQIDDGAKLDLPAIVEVGAGAHRVHVEAPGFVVADLEVEAVADRLTPIPIELEALPGRVMVQTNAGAEIYVDGELRGVAPMGFLPVAAGPHRVAVLDGGTRGYARRFAVERGQQIDIEASLATTGQRRAAMFTLIGAGVLAVAAGTTTALALSAQSTATDIDSNRGISNIELDELEQHNSAVGRRDGLRTATYVLATTAVVSGLVGAALYVFDGVELSDVESGVEFLGEPSAGQTPVASDGRL